MEGSVCFVFRKEVRTLRQFVLRCSWAGREKTETRLLRCTYLPRRMFQKADVSIEDSLKEGRVVHLRVAGLYGRGWSSVFVELASLSLVRELGARGAIFVVFDFWSGGCIVSVRERTGGQIFARCFFLHGLRRDTGACICAKRGGCSSQEFACCCGSDIWRGEGEQFFERICFRGGGGSGDGFAQFESEHKRGFRW